MHSKEEVTPNIQCFYICYVPCQQSDPNEISEGDYSANDALIQSLVVNQESSITDSIPSKCEQINPTSITSSAAVLSDEINILYNNCTLSEVSPCETS